VSDLEKGETRQGRMSAGAPAKQQVGGRPHAGAG